MLKEQQKGNTKQEETMNEKMDSMKSQMPKMHNMGSMKVPSIKMPKL